MYILDIWFGCRINDDDFLYDELEFVEFDFTIDPNQFEAYRIFCILSEELFRGGNVKGKLSHSYHKGKDSALTNLDKMKLKIPVRLQIFR